MYEEEDKPKMIFTVLFNHKLPSMINLLTFTITILQVISTMVSDCMTMSNLLH